MCAGCQPGWYGEDCKLRCGHCLGTEPCHHINGSCQRGCQDNYITDWCSTCKKYVLCSLCIHDLPKYNFRFYHILTSVIEILLFKNMSIMSNFIMSRMICKNDEDYTCNCCFDNSYIETS